jgi:predicted ATP-dependent endonuclease of OLD family
MFNRLTIDNYRIFNHLQINDIGRVNLIVGMNNSGKSSLLEAIYLLTSDEPSTSLAFILNERGEFISRMGDPRYDRRIIGGYQISHAFFGHSSDKVSQIAIRADNEKNNFLNISLQDARLLRDTQGAQASLFEEEEVDTEGRVQNLTFEHIKPGAELKKETMRVIEGDILPYRSSVRGFTLPEQSSRLVTTNYLAYDDLAILWDTITLTPREDLVVEALKILEPRVERISFTSRRTSNSGILLKLKGESEPVPLGSMGDGMRRVLTIIASLVSVDKGTLLVDEIDTGLYYAVLTNMWKLILETANRRRVQVFASTHSWDCVLAFQEALKGFADPTIGRLIRMEKIDGGVKSIVFSAKELDIAIKQGIEVR